MMLNRNWSLHAALVSLLVFQTVAIDTSAFTKASNDSLLWGPYRPNLYFGIRPRLPQSLSLGLLWAKTEEFNQISQNVRYTCEQNEGMAGYGWDAYDPRKGGVQTIHDKENNVDIETKFVKLDGGAWAARIKGTPRGNADRLPTSIWLTLNLEGLGSLETQDADSGEELGFEGDVTFSGTTADLGDFTVKVTEPDSVNHPVHRHDSYAKKPLDRTLVHSMQVPAEVLWQGKTLVFSSIKTTIDQYVEEYTAEAMPEPYQVWTIQNQPGQGNVHLIQKVFEGPFEFDVAFQPAESKTELSSDYLDKQFNAVRKSFDSLYGQVLKPLPPYSAPKYLEFSQSLFSNLIGGIGYFYGDQLIDRSYAAEYEEVNEGFWEEAEEARALGNQKLEGPYELFTSIPSRPFFPRGFLWDEGFHLLPILDWDMELVMQIVSSWFNTMDADGWIPREQILGPEARSKVPAEFQVQYPHYANPPTLFMVIEALLDKVQGTESVAKTTGNDYAKPEAVKDWVKSIYPLLQRNFEWYRRTQSGDIKSYDRPAFSSKEAYRWRGRTPRHILTSGLDDYPRAQPPHPAELHTDLISWMGMTARSLHKIAAFLGESEDEERYSKISEAIIRNVDDLHWDKGERTYCDASLDDYEDSTHVCHKGYISIFPFMTGLLGPNHKHLPDILDLIADENELWSPHGIRSLSKSDEFYGTDENYWRNPVWMNMNYLIAKNLHTIASTKGPEQKRAATLFSALRRNLVDTVFVSWQDTGFAWEQYNPESGQGQRTQHFTGWTSLVVKLMALPDLSGKDIHDEL